jgi:ADP-ribosylglycohydrolase
MAHRFARSYRWSRGYGPGAARLLKRIARGQDWESASVSVYPSGSYGNGGAMRAPPSIWRPASWRSRSRPC